jgi:LacI family transcriptional regulator
MLVGAEHAQETSLLLRSAGVPVVLTWVGAPEFAAVTVDNARAGRLAAEHLVGLGHRRIGLIVGDLSFNDRQRARLEGVREALRKAGLDLPEGLVTQQPLTIAGGRAGGARLLDLADRPSAIIGGIDLFAIGCIQEAQARGLGVPAGLSVVGVDDIDMSAHMSPPITTVHVPTAQIGQGAASALLAGIAGSAPPARIALNVELVVRRSSGPA